MTLVVIVEAVVIALLLVLVAGLLKSHAEILRQLDALNRGLETQPSPRPQTSGLESVPVQHLTGIDPQGVAVSLSLKNGRSDTLIAFLSSGCASCLVFWNELGNNSLTSRIAGRTVVVTKSTDHESPKKIADLAPQGITVVMSDEMWDEFRVPLTPYFALVSADGGILGEGSATTTDRLTDLLAQSAAESQPLSLDTKKRAQRVDESLLSSGVEPGDASLYQDPLGP